MSLESKLKSQLQIQQSEFIQKQSSLEQNAQNLNFEIKKHADKEKFYEIEMENKKKEVEEALKAQKLLEKEKKNSQITLQKL